ncbi:MAG: DNA polymerase III subunit beta [Pseudomonadota bacterium]|nr:DNA polymerase III subunit beta [Pseudomonadota bacterium]|tara:strand:- start:2520 stop:3623 length:1104 start_codon:yes stop_codon:yes gene_type:complete
MKFIAKKEQIVDILQMGAAIAERRQTIPILANLRIKAENSLVEITATDLEIQIKSASKVSKVEEEGETTVSARKMSELCRMLPANEDLEFSVNQGKLTVKSRNFHADFATLSAADFPELEVGEHEKALKISSSSLKRLFNKTQFCMATQDVRYYLNGLLLEINDGNLVAVATDGHRLASASNQIELKEDEIIRNILPRKAVTELAKILKDEDESIELSIGSSSLRIKDKGLDFSSKLIDGKFPDYERVFPQGSPNEMLLSKEDFQSALSRASVLSNEKYRGVRLILAENSLKLMANNPEQESAEEDLSVKYTGPSMEIGFNIGYLLDVLGAIDSDDVLLSFFGEESSCLVNDPENHSETYVIMPMRL